MEYSAKQLMLEKPSVKKLQTNEEYGILLVVKGSVQVNNSWVVGQEQLLVCKPHQSLRLEYAGGHTPLKAFFIRLSLELLKKYSTAQTELVPSFEVNPEPVAALRGQSELLMLLKNLAAWLYSLPNESTRYAADILEEGTLKMFISLVLRICIMSDLNTMHKGEHLALDDVFNYIHAHLSEDLTLEHLEKEFYVSRSHLIRQFKLRTGQTVHQYIIKARLDRCRHYIEQGDSVTEVYKKGGFGGYNHFFRAFKKEYGMTPKEYYRHVKGMYSVGTG